MNKSKVILFSQFRPARLAGLFFAFAILTSCAKDPFDVLARYGEGYGLAYPRFQSVQDLQTVSIAYPNGKPTKSPVRHYEVSAVRPCITKAGSRIHLTINCYREETTNYKKLDRLNFVADFIAQGYDLLAEVAHVPIINLNLVEVSPEVTRAGFYLRRDIDVRGDVSELTYFFPHAKENIVKQSISLAQDIYHELIHFIIWENHGDPDTVLGNEFTAYFIASNAAIILVFPKVIAEMRIEAQGHANGLSYKRMLQHLKDVESLDNFEPDANKGWKRQQLGVKQLAREFFWQILFQTHARCISSAPILKKMIAGLIEYPESPSAVIEEVYQNLRDKNVSNMVCEHAFHVKETGSHLKGTEVVFR